MLANISEIILPIERPLSKHTFHLFLTCCEKWNQLTQFLQEKGIETASHYPTPLPEMQAYQYLGHQPQDFPICHQYQYEILSLPIYAELTFTQIDFVAV